MSLSRSMGNVVWGERGQRAERIPHDDRIVLGWSAQRSTRNPMPPSVSERAPQDIRPTSCGPSPAAGDRAAEVVFGQLVGYDCRATEAEPRAIL